MKRTPIARVSSDRSKQLSQYQKVRDEYLTAHPLCQATLLEYRIPESWALANYATERGGAIVRYDGKRRYIPAATEIHHRNKRHGERLTDPRWFLAVSQGQHDFIERFKAKAREFGWLLDVSANPDGMTPGGVQALTTEELFSAMGIIATQET